MRCAVLLAVLLVASCSDAAAPHGERSAESSQAAAIIGTTLDAASGEVLAGVEILGPAGAQARSDARGHFELAGLAPGWSGAITARAADGRSAAVTMLPLTAGTREVVLHLR